MQDNVATKATIITDAYRSYIGLEKEYTHIRVNMLRNL
jgi:hypothetical protein